MRLFVEGSWFSSIASACRENLIMHKWRLNLNNNTWHGTGKRGHNVADTLLLMMFLGLRKLGNICCGHKMFLNKIRNIFCVPDTTFVFATNVARAGKRGNFCVGNNVSATMCPYLPGPLASISRQRNFHMNVRLRIREYLLFKFRRILQSGPQPELDI